jgi:hypothetical protein
MNATLKPSLPTNEFDLVVNGQLVPGAGRLGAINPAIGRVFATCAGADQSQVNAAVMAVFAG